MSDQVIPESTLTEALVPELIAPEQTLGSQNVDQISIGGKEIFLVGTAHVSKASADLAEQVIRQVKPDSVAIELCEPRYQSLKNPDRWKNMDIVSVIRQGKAYVLMAQLMLAAFQKKLGDQLKIKPGAEMVRAAEIAEATGARIILADRNVTTTLKRTWASLGFWSMGKLFFAMLGGLFSDQKIDEAEIERLKSSDALDELMREFSKALPEVRISLIDERDKYLAEKIQSAPGTRIVAIVGAGHVAGIKRYLGTKIDIQALDALPPPSPFARLLGMGIPALFVALIVGGFFYSGAETSAHMVGAWILITGGFAALGSLIALGHPLTILSAFVASPFTTIHPLLASGWVAGLVEAMIRKPRVGDLEHIAEDLSTYGGWYRNRVSRILLIMALTNLFGTIGALWGIKVVASML
jgi:pheromone shutdown-related protein TraB